MTEKQHFPADTGAGADGRKMSEDNLLNDEVSDVKKTADEAADTISDATKDAVAEKADEVLGAIAENTEVVLGAVADTAAENTEVVLDATADTAAENTEVVLDATADTAAENTEVALDTTADTVANVTLEAIQENAEDATEGIFVTENTGDAEKTELNGNENVTNGGAAFSDETVKTSASKGDEVEKVSKKTTVVLICTIVVLVMLIVVFAVIIGKKYFDSKNKDNSGNNTQETAIEVDDKGNKNTDETPSVTEAPVDDDNTETVAPKEYDVTVELGQYKGIEVDFPEITISDEDIDYEIENFVEDLSEDVPVDRASQNGDKLNIDYKGYMDGEEFEGGSAEGVDFELGSGYFFDAFEEGLVGKELGEYTLELNFPDDYYEDLAGKPVTFVVTINSIAETVVPELSDQLVADNTDCETIEEYRAFVKGELTEEAEADAEERLDRDILSKAIENATFGGEIDEEIDDLTDQYFAYYDQMAQSYYGMTGAQLFNTFYGMTEEEYGATLREESSYSVKIQHLLDKIAEEENIGYTDEEYKAEFEEIFFSYYGFTEEAEVKEQLSDEEIDKIVIRSIKQKKAQDIITDNAVINR